MEAHAHPAELDARLRARAVERREQLLEQARDRNRRSSTVVLMWPLFALLMVGFLGWWEPAERIAEMFGGLLALFVMILALDLRVSRRLDAIVKLLEEESDRGAP